MEEYPGLSKWTQRRIRFNSRKCDCKTKRQCMEEAIKMEKSKEIFLKSLEIFFIEVSRRNIAVLIP